jgi:hypothetical protein
MKDLTLENPSDFDIEAYKEYMLQQSIDDFIRGTIGQELHPITDKIVDFVNLPDRGSHLVTPRIGYTHHGIYVGAGYVIQYSGFSGESFNTHDIVAINQQKRSPIEVVSLNDFTQGERYWIEDHPYTKFTREEIVQRAYSRVKEQKYNLVFNNCEHFANWCVYGVEHSHQVNRVTKVIKPIKHVADAKHIGKMFKAYMDGTISGEKLLDEIGHLSTTGVSSAFYAGLGQIAIPVPFVGAAIGALAGYTIGNMLYSSQMFSVTGDAAIVKQAKARRAKLEKISSIMLPIMKENRKKLELYVDTYFADRRRLLNLSFNKLDEALENNDYDKTYESLSEINKSFGKKLTHSSFEEFDAWMQS